MRGGALLRIRFNRNPSQKSCAMRQMPSLRRGANKDDYSVLQIGYCVFSTSKSHGYHTEILSSSSYSNRRLRTARSRFDPPNRFGTAYLQSHLRLVGLVSRQYDLRREQETARESLTCTPYSVRTCSPSLSQVQLPLRLDSSFTGNGRRSRRPLSVSNANPPSITK